VLFSRAHERMSTDSSGDFTPAAFGDEAGSHIRSTSASTELVAEWMRWLRVPPVSGLECVQALRGDGFEVVARLPGCVELRREHLVVHVPLADRMGPEVLITILLKAHVAPVRFFELIDGGIASAALARSREP
jgi:hypothetical protein